MAKFCKQIFLLLCVFLLPIKPLILSVGSFVVLDTIIGILRARKSNIRITSKRFNQIWVKTIVYQGVIITTYILDVSLLNDVIFNIISIQFLATKLVALGIIGNEVKSIDESLMSMGIDIWQRIEDFFKIAKKIRSHIGDLKEGGDKDVD